MAQAMFVLMSFLLSQFRLRLVLSILFQCLSSGKFSLWCRVSWFPVFTPPFVTQLFGLVLLHLFGASAHPWPAMSAGPGQGARWRPVHPEWHRQTAGRLDREREHKWNAWYKAYDKWWEEADGIEPTAEPSAPASKEDRPPPWADFDPRSRDPWVEEAAWDLLSHRIQTCSPASFAPQEKIWMCLGRPVKVSGPH